MSLLENESLIRAVSEGPLEERLILMPLLDPDEQIGPGSIDLRLGTEFLETRRVAEGVHDPFEQGQSGREKTEEQIVVPLGENFVLHPGQFVLGATLEFLKMPRNLAGQVLGRSSWGRHGLVVATAVTVQPGFAGCLTLELVNTGAVPIYLYPGLRVAQLMVWTLNKPTASPYSGRKTKYKGPLGPQSSRLGWEIAERDKIRRIGRALRGEDPETEDQPDA